MDIPISGNTNIITEHLKGKLEEFTHKASCLWHSKLPLHQSCQIGKLAYYFKGLFCSPQVTPKELDCIGHTDSNIEALLPEVLRDVPSVLRSLPFQFGGLNMSTLSDLAATRLRNGQKPRGFEHIDIPPRTTESFEIEHCFYLWKLLQDPSLQDRTIFQTHHPSPEATHTGETRSSRPLSIRYVAWTTPMCTGKPSTGAQCTRTRAATWRTSPCAR